MNLHLVKNWICNWFNRNKYESKFICVMKTFYKENNTTSNEHSCELKVTNIDYVGCGIGPKKRDSELKAAEDFANFLLSSDLISDQDKGNLRNAMNGLRSTNDSIQAGSKKRRKKKHVEENQMKDLDSMSDFIQAENKKKRKYVEENQSVEEPQSHGGWCLKSSRERLNRFLDLNKIKADYEYFHHPSIGKYACLLNFPLKDLGRLVSGKGIARTKQAASRECAFKIISLLYDENLVEERVLKVEEKDDLKSLGINECSVVRDLKSRLLMWSDQWMMVNNIRPKYKYSTIGNPPKQFNYCEIMCMDLGTNKPLEGIEVVSAIGASKKFSKSGATVKLVEELVAKERIAMENVVGMDDEGTVEETDGNENEDVLGSEYDDCYIYEKIDEEDKKKHLHGNWDSISAIQCCSNYFQDKSFSPTYKFDLVTPKSLKSNSFVKLCTIDLDLDKLGKKIKARGIGLAREGSKRAAVLSLFRQLFHLNQVPAYHPGCLTKSRKEKNLAKIAKKTPNKGHSLVQRKIVDVCFSPELLEKIDYLLNVFYLEPKAPNMIIKNRQSLLTGVVLEEMQTMTDGVEKYQTIRWSPPIANWNCWTSCEIMQGPYYNRTRDEISSEFAHKFKSTCTSPSYVKMMEKRDILPIAKCKHKILDAIYHDRVIIIKGSTGSGKTTQVCQYILDDHIQNNRGSYCNIIVTQPRRISATSLASRIAKERNEPIGKSVGYKVRFDSKPPRPYGAIMFCTVGILLKKLEDGLAGTSHIIVDEIHERDLNTDFLIIILRNLIMEYPNIRIILMSATMDVRMFSDYFAQPHVIEIPGAAYPVRQYFLEDFIQLTNYKGLQGRKNNSEFADIMSRDYKQLNIVNGDSYSNETRKVLAGIPENVISFEVIEAILIHINSMPQKGAVLIFLPGWASIFGLKAYLHKSRNIKIADYLILPLHSKLNFDEQQKVFDHAPDGVTKVILATNIAESSITIDDIVYVIDSGRVKLKGYNAQNNQTDYSTVWTSKGNILQRMGRAGRLREGFCFVLCSKARFNTFSQSLKPEMLRISLHEVGLTIKILGFGDISIFLSNAIEMPPMHKVVEAEQLLIDINCLDQEKRLTPLGLIVGRLPIDPRLGRMLILGCVFSCGDEIATLAALISESMDIFTKDCNRVEDFSSKRLSDDLAMLRAFYEWKDAESVNWSNGRSYCFEKGLSINALKFACEAKNQLIDILIENGFPDECFKRNSLNFVGPDRILDTVRALISMGRSSNLAVMIAKKRAVVDVNEFAIVHSSSVNKSVEDAHAKFFVFSEKIRMIGGMCKLKQLSLITPIDILLFGCKEVCWDGNRAQVLINGWLPMFMNGLAAAKIVALRSIFDLLICRIAKRPERMVQIAPEELKILTILQDIFSMDAFQLQSQWDPNVPSILEIETVKSKPVMDNEDVQMINDPPSVYMSSEIPSQPAINSSNGDQIKKNNNTENYNDDLTPSNLQSSSYNHNENLKVQDKKRKREDDFYPQRVANPCFGEEYGSYNSNEPPFQPTPDTLNQRKIIENRESRDYYSKGGLTNSTNNDASGHWKIQSKDKTKMEEKESNAADQVPVNSGSTLGGFVPSAHSLNFLPLKKMKNDDKISESIKNIIDSIKNISNTG